MPTAAPRPRLSPFAALVLGGLTSLAGPDALAGAVDPSRSVAASPRVAARVWYVDNTAPDGGDGSLVAPFASLERAERAADAGDTLYVFRGDGTSRGLDEGIRLRPGQRLIGSGVPFEPPGEEALPAGEPPRLAAAQGVVVELADRASVAGVAIAGGGAEAGIRATGARGVSVRDVHIDGGGTLPVGLSLHDVQGAAVGSLRVSGARVHALLAERSGGVLVHDSRLDHGGEAGAAVVVLDPAGHVELTALDIHPASGAAVSIEARAGTGTVAVERASLQTEAGSGASGVEIAASGTAVLEVQVVRTALSGLGGPGLVARASGGARLGLRLAGSGFLDAAAATEAVAVHATERADLRLEIAGNDLLAGELGLFLTAAGEARVAAEIADNSVPAVPRGRGMAVVLAERAEALVRLSRNRLSGHRAEALFVAAGGASRLALDLHENQVEPAAPAPVAALPALLLRAEDEARLCVALAGNRVGAGMGGGPPMALEQSGSAVVALAGHEPGAGSSGAVLAATNQLAATGVAIQGVLGSPAGLLCPTPGAPPPLAAR